MREIDFNFESKYEVINQFPKNLNTKLYLWSPQDNQSANDIVIMVNGFLDGTLGERGNRRAWEKYFYKFIGEELSRQNIASILLPLPFHFGRGDDINDFSERRFAPLERLKENGAYLYYGGYDQAKEDIKKLITEIKNNRSKFGLTNSDIKIHLLGYSLGGAAVMGAASELKDMVSSLTVLFSSWKIADLDPNSLGNSFRIFGFNSEDWKTAINQLEKNKESYDPVFRSIMWGDNSLTPWFADSPSRILFIQALQDETFPVEMVYKNNLQFYNYIEKLKSEIQINKECAFIFSSMTHLHTNISESAKRQIAGYIRSFVANPAI